MQKSKRNVRKKLEFLFHHQENNSDEKTTVKQDATLRIITSKVID